MQTPLDLATACRPIEQLEAEVARLRQDEERGQAIFAAMEEAFGLFEVVLDDGGELADLRYLEVNRAFAALVGRTPEEMVGRTVRELFPSAAPGLVEAVAKVASSGAPAQFSAHGEISRRDYEVQAWSPQQGRCAALFRDVTEHKRAEEALREREQRYRAVLENSRDAVIVADPTGEGCILAANPAAAALFGWTEEEMVGLARADILEASDPRLDEALRERDRSGEMRAELIYRRKDGTTFVGELSSGLFTRSDGGAASVAVIRDVTERKQAEEALRESEARFRQVLEHSRDAIYRLDLRTNRYGYVSPSMQALTGYTPDEIGAMPRERARERLHLDDREAFASALASLLQRPPGERSDTIVYRWLHKDGRYRWISNSWAVVTDAEDRPLALVGTLRDITARKEMEQRLIDLNETLEERVVERTRQLRALAAELTEAEERERRRLARYLHDDLQQSLVAIAFHLEHIHQRRLAQGGDGDLQEPIDLLHEAISSSRSLTAELSPSILYESGLGPALQWLGRRMEELHGLRVTVEAPELGSVPLLANDVRLLLFQSARELLFNVVKHAGVAEATVTYTRPTPARAVVTVTDAGKGFDPGQARRRDGQDGGLGLFSIVERLAHIGGSVEIDSAPGRGARLTLTAPAQPLMAVAKGGIGAQEEGETRLGVTAASASAASAPNGRIRILLVDDHAIVRKGLLLLLDEQPDMVVVGEAADGREAVDLARKLDPDVVLMDVAMPNMNGIEATRRIAAERPEVRIIGLTMYDDPDQEARMRRAGARGYVPKGGPPGALLAAIRNAT